MLKAYRENRVLSIEDIKADEYIAMGYTVKTAEGTEIGHPETKESLKADLEKANARIKELEEQLSKKTKKTTAE